MSELQQPAYRTLRHRDFRRLGAATLVSVIGTQMQNVGIDWHIYVLTRSPLALGSVGLVRVIPIILRPVDNCRAALATRGDRGRPRVATERFAI